MNDFANPVNLANPNERRLVFAAQHGDDSALMIEFFTAPIYMEAISTDLGRPVFHERVHTRIVTPGNAKTVWVHQTKGLRYDEEGNYAVDPNDPNCEPTRSPPFEKAWSKFTNKNVKLHEGWPIEEWPPITRSYAETLKGMNVHTVEQLAKLSDANVENIMGGRKYRDLAIAALDQAKGAEMLSHQQEETNKLLERVAALEKANKELKALRK